MGLIHDGVSAQQVSLNKIRGLVRGEARQASRGRSVYGCLRCSGMNDSVQLAAQAKGCRSTLGSWVPGSATRVLSERRVAA